MTPASAPVAGWPKSLRPIIRRNQVAVEPGRLYRRLSCLLSTGLPPCDQNKASAEDEPANARSIPGP
jgi:hypothetical protein